MKHEIGRNIDGFKCAVCEWSWTKTPNSDCPGLKRYAWGKWPEHLLTKTQLNEAGYQTGKKLPPPIAVVWRMKESDWMYLYDRNAATPKRPVSTAQREAIQKAQDALKTANTCRRCGGHAYYPERGGGLCYYCDLELMHINVRNRAISWSSDLQTRDFVVFDSETTGLWNAEFVQVAVIDSHRNVLVNTYVKPENPAKLLEKDDRGVCASDINGITPDMVADAPTFPDVYPLLKTALQGKTVIIYNENFDHPILDALCKEYQLPRIEADYDCAMLVYADFCGEWSDYHKSYRWQKLEGGDHSALGDCLATLDLIEAMANTEKKEAA